MLSGSLSKEIPSRKRAYRLPVPVVPPRFSICTLWPLVEPCDLPRPSLAAYRIPPAVSHDFYDNMSKLRVSGPLDYSPQAVPPRFARPPFTRFSQSTLGAFIYLFVYMMVHLCGGSTFSLLPSRAGTFWIAINANIFTLVLGAPTAGAPPVKVVL